MSAELDGLIRKSKDLEMRIEQLTAEISRLRAAIAEHMGDRREYYGQGVVAKKWAHVRWEVDKALLLDELSTEALDYCKAVVLTKSKLEQAVRAGYLPPRLYDRAIKREDRGWNVSLQILETPESEAGRDREK